MADPATANGSSRKRRWGRTLYVLFLVVFTLACAEVGARWYLMHVLGKATTKKFRFNSYRVYEHVPGFHEGDGTHDWIVINGQGFRRREEVALTKPLNTYRIFLMGGSAAHGISSAPPYPVVHIMPEETIDAYLEGMLAKAHPARRVEVINAAVTGYSVFQHTAYLLGELLDYDPDMVIFFDGANDHYTNNTDHRYMADFRYQFWDPRLKYPSLGGQFDYLAHYLAEYSGLFRAYIAWKMNRDAFQNALHSSMVTSFNTLDERIAAHRRMAHRQFLRSMETNLFLLRREINAVVCLQPMLALRDSAEQSPEEQGFPRLVEDPNVRMLYPVVKEELADVAHRWNLPLIDMNVPFNDPKWRGRQLMIDYCHLTPLGGQAAAQAMLPMVDSLMRAPPLPFTIHLDGTMKTMDSAIVRAPAASGT